MKQVNSVWGEEKQSVQELRWSLHQWPELGNQEFRTTQQLHAFLSERGIDCKTFLGKTGAIALIDNKRPFTVGLRVDLDALPIQENTGIDCPSQNPGVMHACGHDMHTSIGVGVALVASRLKDILPVNLKVIFQPAEECSPSGGSRSMIEGGVLKEPEVSMMLGLHVWPDYKVGEIGVRAGAIMAASDKFRIVVSGVRSHAAQPYKGVDSILIASEIVSAAYKKLPRQIDPFNPYVLTIGEILSRGRYNVICDHVEMVGTLRTFAPATREFIHNWLNETVSAIANMHGGKAELQLERGYDVVINNSELTEIFIQYAMEALGTSSVNTTNNPSFIAEDFSAFSATVPSVYFHLGCNSTYPLHSDKFLPQDETLDAGVILLSSFLLSPQLLSYVQNAK